MASTFVSGGTMAEKREEVTGDTPNYWAMSQRNNSIVPKAKVGLGSKEMRTNIMHSVKIQADLLPLTNNQFEKVH